MPNAPDAEAFARDLAAAGHPLDVEARDGLAILSPTAGNQAGLSVEERRHVQELARRHGFTHAALEILRP